MQICRVFTGSVTYIDWLSWGNHKGKDVVSVMYDDIPSYHFRGESLSLALAMFHAHLAIDHIMAYITSYMIILTACYTYLCSYLFQF